jgi:uncharacterized protein
MLPMFRPGPVGSAWIGRVIEFISDPFVQPAEVSGLLTGQLHFITNKRDFDFSVTLFELTPKGDYFHLSYYWARASYVTNNTRRRLLIPGDRQRLGFESGRLTKPPVRTGQPKSVGRWESSGRR